VAGGGQTLTVLVADAVAAGSAAVEAVALPAV
jgi:hypothetical protein